MGLRDQIGLSYICTDCGEEVACGIFNAVNHDSTCKRNAPNESIKSHKWKQEQDEKQKIEEENFIPIWNKMNTQERDRLVLLSMNGFPQGNGIVLMGLYQMKMYNDFKNEMINKYETPPHRRPHH